MKMLTFLLKSHKSCYHSLQKTAAVVCNLQMIVFRACMEHLPAVEWRYQCPGAAWMGCDFGRGRPALTGSTPLADKSQFVLLLLELYAEFAKK